MQKRMLGKTGYEIAPVVFGGIINTDQTQGDADRYVAYAVDRGVNFFDVAPAYGNAEERLGGALARYRKDVYLACKTGMRDAKGAKEDLLNSLRVLRTDYFDVYQLHGIKTKDEVERAFAPGGAMETFEWALKEGVVRKLGVTAHNEENALLCLDKYDFASVLFTMNWAHGVLYGLGDKLSETVRARDIGLLCMKVHAYRMYAEGEPKPSRVWYKYTEPGSPLAVAAMKYGFAKGGTALVPPGNFEIFRYTLDVVDELLANPLSGAELELLKSEAEAIRGRELDLDL